ncbi:MAG: FKBP-type peptidyl-prolyl cis-trans isomerase [Chitinophagaceae bacterium]
MKKILLVVISFSLLVVSCSKKDATCARNDSNISASASEITNLQTYLTSNNITATQHQSGFFYKITQVGSGQAVVNLCSKITIKYVGKLTNGTVFDQTTGAATATFELGQLIVGWQKGIPLISSGGKITLYIPPSLGYGSSGSGPIPANSILIFDIELIAVS